MSGVDREFLKRCLAEGLSLDGIAKRAGKHPSTVSHHLRKHGLQPLGHARHSPNGKVNPTELRTLVEEGATVREAAEHFSVGYSTIRHWLKRLGIETAHARRLRRSREAAEAGEPEPTLECRRHGRVRFVRRHDGNFRCSRCQTEAVTEWRRLVARAGGRCQLCGYDRHPAVLQFHHVDPSTKAFMVSRDGVTRSFAEAAAEADKCVLLCGNCHAEVEAGVTELPTRLTLKWARQ